MKIAKTVDLDALPTVIGAIVLVDLLVFNGNLTDTLAPAALLAAIAMALAALSVVRSFTKHRKFGIFGALNILWLIAGLLIIGYLIVFKLTYHF